jgi:hypothetical protein
METLLKSQECCSYWSLAHLPLNTCFGDRKPIGQGVTQVVVSLVGPACIFETTISSEFGQQSFNTYHVPQFQFLSNYVIIPGTCHRKMLCESCSNLTIDRLYSRACEHGPTSSGWNQAGYLILHSSYRSLEIAVTRGCDNCQIFHSRFIIVCGNVQALRTRIERLAESQDASLPIIAFLHTEPDEDKAKRTIHQLYLQVGIEPWKPGVDHLSIAFRICVPRGIDQFSLSYMLTPN